MIFTSRIFCELEEKKLMRGEYIKSARLKAGMTQRELAASTKLPQGHISKLERNLLNIARVRVDTLDRLCKELHVTPNDLMGYVRASSE
jgi:transcriptional regulator with XRE-family HTH domain